jgi:hypothetical protein
MAVIARSAGASEHRFTAAKAGAIHRIGNRFDSKGQIGSLDAAPRKSLKAGGNPRQQSFPRFKFWNQPTNRLQ